MYVRSTDCHGASVLVVNNIRKVFKRNLNASCWTESRIWGMAASFDLVALGTCNVLCNGCYSLQRGCLSILAERATYREKLTAENRKCKAELRTTVATSSAVLGLTEHVASWADVSSQCRTSLVYCNVPGRNTERIPMLAAISTQMSSWALIRIAAPNTVKDMARMLYNFMTCLWGRIQSINQGWTIWLRMF